MKFDKKCEELLKKYTLNEGIGTAIGNTLKRTFVKPFTELNPWKSDHGNWAQDSMDKKNAKNALNPQSGAKQSEAALNAQKVLTDYRNNQLKSNVITAKEISLLDGATVIGKFRLNCPEVLKNKATYNNLLLTDASATPDQIQKGLEFISNYDLRRLNLIDFQAEKELSSLINVELLKAKIDPALIGSKITEVLKEIKNEITTILGPYDLRSHPNIFMKVIWFFIFYKQSQLKR